jgi:hypothetical protein
MPNPFAMDFGAAQPNALDAQLGLDMGGIAPAPIDMGVNPFSDDLLSLPLDALSPAASAPVVSNAAPQGLQGIGEAFNFDLANGGIADLGVGDQPNQVNLMGDMVGNSPVSLNDGLGLEAQPLDFNLGGGQLSATPVAPPLNLTADEGAVPNLGLPGLESPLNSLAMGQLDNNMSVRPPESLSSPLASDGVGAASLADLGSGAIGDFNLNVAAPNQQSMAVMDVDAMPMAMPADAQTLQSGGEPLLGGIGLPDDGLGLLNFAAPPPPVALPLEGAIEGVMPGGETLMPPPAVDFAGLPPPPPVIPQDAEDATATNNAISTNFGGLVPDFSNINNMNEGAVETVPVRDGFGVNVDASDDAADWRAAVIKGDFNADLTGRLVSQAFASEIEKHLAIQCVALVAGNCDSLSNWHWRVWRRADEFGYPLTGKERFPAQMSASSLHTTLHKFLIAMGPLLARVHSRHFTVKFLQKRFDLTPQMVERLRKPLTWDTGILVNCGLKHYAARIKTANFVAYNLPGIGKELFFDGPNRAIYLDEAYYRKAPPSHLFHRVLGIIWSYQIHYITPLALDPQKEIMPVITSLHEMLSKQGFSRIKMQLTSRPALLKYVRDTDLKRLKPLYEKVGMPTEEQVVQLWEAMRVHVYRMQLAETLDVIGLFESLLDKDLLRPYLMRHSEIYQQLPQAKALLEFVTKLKI